jgi:biotin-(acetyl-CoA carboxylase) ligase
MLMGKSVIPRRRVAAFVALSSVSRLPFTGGLLADGIASSMTNKTVLQTALFSSDYSSASLSVFHLKESVGSTQDEARAILHARDASDRERCIAVIADEQTQGRGTQGRKWEGGSRKGNLYLTIGIPFDSIRSKITLLPLQIAVLIAQRVKRLLDACPEGEDDGVRRQIGAKTTVKWPNDVLVNEKKLAGTLIENESVDQRTWFLIGVGVNVAFAPGLTESPGKQIREATCIQDFCPSTLPESTALALGTDLARGLVEWALDTETDRFVKETKVIEEWKALSEFGKTYELRGEVVDENSGTYQGEAVTLVDIQDDGQLLVRGVDGRERLLIADYMF